MQTTAMLYQDRKIIALLRVLAIGFALAIALATMIVFRPALEPLIDKFGGYRAHGNEYWILISVCAFMSPACIGIAIWSMFMSPEQDAAFAQRKSRKIPPTLQESDNPHYSIATWRYFLARLRV